MIRLIAIIFSFSVFWMYSCGYAQNIGSVEVNSAASGNETVEQENAEDSLARTHNGNVGFNGVKVELVSICNKQTGLTYGPDGKLIDKPGYNIEWPPIDTKPDFNRLTDMNLAVKYEYDQEHINFDWYDVVVKVDGSKDKNNRWVSWEVDHDGVIWPEKELSGGNSKDQYCAARLRLPKGTSQANIKLGVNARNWKLLETFNEPGEYNVGKYQVKLILDNSGFSKNYASVRCMHNIEDYLVKLELEDNEGNVYERSRNSSRVYDGYHILNQAIKNEISENIKEYRIYIGNKDWFVLNDIKLPTAALESRAGGQENSQEPKLKMEMYELPGVGKIAVYRTGDPNDLQKKMAKAIATEGIPKEKFEPLEYKSPWSISYEDWSNGIFIGGPRQDIFNYDSWYYYNSWHCYDWRYYGNREEYERYRDRLYDPEYSGKRMRVIYEVERNKD